MRLFFASAVGVIAPPPPFPLVRNCREVVIGYKLQRRREVAGYRVWPQFVPRTETAAATGTCSFFDTRQVDSCRHPLSVDSSFGCAWGPDHWSPVCLDEIVVAKGAHTRQCHLWCLKAVHKPAQTETCTLGRTMIPAHESFPNIFCGCHSSDFKILSFVQFWATH